MKAHICKCNGCGNLLIDENPQIGAEETELTGNELEMELFFVELNDPETAYFGCPVCCTDSYLMDLSN